MCKLSKSTFPTFVRLLLYPQTMRFYFTTHLGCPLSLPSFTSRPFRTICRSRPFSRNHCNDVPLVLPYHKHTSYQPITMAQTLINLHEQGAVRTLKLQPRSAITRRYNQDRWVKCARRLAGLNGDLKAENNTVKLACHAVRTRRKRLLYFFVLVIIYEVFTHTYIYILTFYLTYYIKHKKIQHIVSSTENKPWKTLAHGATENFTPPASSCAHPILPQFPADTTEIVKLDQFFLSSPIKLNTKKQGNMKCSEEELKKKETWQWKCTSCSPRVVNSNFCCWGPGYCLKWIIACFPGQNPRVDI